MTTYEQSIIGYALNHQDPLPVLRLNGKFSDQKLNYLSTIARTVHFDLLSITEALDKTVDGLNSHDLVVAMNASLIDEKSLEVYVRKVEEEYSLSKASNILSKIHNKPVTKELIADIIKNLSSISYTSNEKPDIEQAIRDFSDIQEKFVIAHSEGKKIIGHSTGYYELDKLTDGIQDHHLWTVAAYTSAGKTTFALNIVRSLVIEGIPVVFYSLEMSRAELYAKLISMQSRLGTWHLKRAGTDAENYEKYTQAREESRKWPLKIYDKKSDIQEIILSMKEESLRGAKVFVIDYLQNISDVRARSEYELITNAVHDIQNTTLSLPVSTIMVSQISNEDSKNSSALSVNAKGSGAVRAASDLFVYLQNTLKEKEIFDKYRSRENIPMKLVISKHRHGRISAIDMEREQESGLIFEMP